MSSATTIARRYAQALAEAAEARGQLASVAEELSAFAALVRDHAELYDVFASPALAPEDKSAVLEAVLERAKPSPILANFLRVLLRNIRLHHLDAVERAFGEEVDRRVGVVTADVTTAAPLSDAERAVLEERLTAVAGSKVRLSFATDGELIGGVVTRIGSRIYDGSIRSKLDAIRRQMSGQARA